MKKKTKKKKVNNLIIILIILIFIIGLSLTIFSQPSSNINNLSPKAELNKQAPDFNIYLIDGSKARLSDFFGRPILLWFVTTWCPSCQIGAKLLSSYYSSLHSKGIIIITILLYNNMGIEGPNLREFAINYAGGFKEGWLFGESDESTTKIYNPNNYLDILYLINRNGIIIYARVGVTEESLNYILSLNV